MITNPLILKRKLKNFAVFLTLFLLFGGLSFIFIRFAQENLTQTQNLQSRATNTSSQVNLLLTPDSIKSPVGLAFTVNPAVVLTAQNKIGFIYLSLVFDPSHLKFISLDKNSLTPGYLVLKVSDENEANSTGILNLMAGVSKEETDSVIAVNLPPLKFEALKEGESTIVFNTAKMEAVFSDSTKAALSVKNDVKVDSNQALLSPTNTPSPSDNPVSSDNPSSSDIPVSSDNPSSSDIPVSSDNPSSSDIPASSNNPALSPALTATPTPTITPISTP